MVNYKAWNIRGLNNLLKLKDVRSFIMSNKLDIVTILETRVKDNNIDKISGNTFGNWSFINNNDLNPCRCI